jgi:hypothetical protein
MSFITLRAMQQMKFLAVRLINKLLFLSHPSKSPLDRKKNATKWSSTSENRFGRATVAECTYKDSCTYNLLAVRTLREAVVSRH